MSAMLVLEDKNIFFGKSVGIKGDSIGEIVFNTAMTGYQEILTDPSYLNQIITFTSAHIGNTGINKEDYESKKIHARGLIIRNFSSNSDHYKSKENLSSFLKKNKKVAISEVDTRRLTHILRNKGTQIGYITTKKHENLSYIYKKIKDFIKKKKNILKQKSSIKKIYSFKKKKNKKKSSTIIHIVVYDFGVKNNILKILKKKNCKISIVPQKTTAKEIFQLKPDGILLSNGPGDPRSYSHAIKEIKKILKKNIPIMGICMGHQLLGLCSNAKIIKMKFGHHGSNHPVEEIKKNCIFITSQNHNFAIDPNNLPKNIKITHLSLFDKSIQGIKRTDKPAFGFQGHPEGSPGPRDIDLLFTKFIKKIIKMKNKGTIFYAQKKRY